MDCYRDVWTLNGNLAGCLCMLSVCVSTKGVWGQLLEMGGNICWNEQRPGSEETCSHSSSATTFLWDLAGLASCQSSLSFQFPSSKMRGWNLKISKVLVNITCQEIPKPRPSVNENPSSIHFY